MRRFCSRKFDLAAIGVLLLLLVPASAFADADIKAPAHSLLLPTDQIWTFIAGNLAPFVAYAINYVGPHVSERIKVLVHVVAGIVAGGIAQAIQVGHVGFNQTTLQFIVTALFGAFLAHNWVWQPSGMNTLAGGGRNRQAERTANDGAPTRQDHI